MKTCFKSCALLSIIMLLGACTLSEIKETIAGSAKPAIHEVKAVVVFDANARFDDHSFNQMAADGADEASKKLGINVAKIPLPKDKTREGFFRFLIADGYNHIIGVGYQNVLPVIEIAREYPDMKFTIIDGFAPEGIPNVKSVRFRDQEGAFLVGIIAAEKSATGKLGFVGAMDIPLIKNFGTGFEQGARYANPKIIVISETIKTKESPWNSPAAAEDSARHLISSGADVLFAAAGVSGVGVLKTANDNGKFAIGVDFNQNGIHPGKVLTSMVKRVDLAVVNTIEDDVHNNWHSGKQELGLAEKGVDYVIDANNQKLISSSLRDKVEKARQNIVAGKLKVYSFKEKREMGDNKEEKNGTE